MSIRMIAYERQRIKVAITNYSMGKKGINREEIKERTSRRQGVGEEREERRRKRRRRRRKKVMHSDIKRR